MPAPRWTRLGSVDEFDGPGPTCREADGLEVIVCRHAGSLHALYNRCSHAGRPLDGGKVVAGRVFCPFHGAAFDVATAQPVGGPATKALHAFAVRIENGMLYADTSVRPAPFAPWMNPLVVGQPNREGMPRNNGMLADDT
jgi:nitrite reductase/ring-hydroxylating ferredoxin subunit